MNITELRTELATDPSGLGYAPLVAADDDQGLADVLNMARDSITIVGKAPRWQVKVILFRALEMAKIESATSAIGANARLLLADPDYENIDLSDQALPSLFAALVAEGTISQASHDAIMALGTRHGSRAEQLGWDAVTVTDVARAVRDELGNKLIGG